MNVLKGERPRITVGPITLGNEGRKRHLQVTFGGSLFYYILDREYQITMEVRSAGVDVSIDGKKELSTSRMIGTVPVITFRSGDYWSKGVAHFGNIVIRPSSASPSPMVAASKPPSDPVKEFSSSLVFIEGANGSGSGFIGNLKGVKQLFTNLHVLAHVENAKLTLLDRSPLEVGPGDAAVDHDVGRLAVSPKAKAIECMQEIEKNASIGDDVVVLGNAEGARVINPIHGKLVGIGPDLVEVDAPFLPGNSGSPIIHVRTGQVIGIATYAIVRDASALTSGSDIKRVRRFGYRLDSIAQWQPIRWPQFFAEAVQNHKSEQLTADFVGLWNDIARHHKITLKLHQNPSIKRPLSEFLNAIHSRKASPTSVDFARRNLISSLRVLSQSDLMEAKPRTIYDYFERALAEETKIRGELFKGLEAMIK